MTVPPPAGPASAADDSHCSQAIQADPQPATDSEKLRVATFNVSLNRPEAGQLIRDLAAKDTQAIAIARILRQLRPDIVLLNEFDYDSEQQAIQLFQQNYLQSPVTADCPFPPLVYPHRFTAEVNTGVDSGLDLDRNGRRNEPADAFGFGRFPGQYGMVVLSRYPINSAAVRTFQKLLWHQMPEAARPFDPATGEPWYPHAVWQQLRLSSKSHWDVPVVVGDRELHLLASHPTPPAFDGPEQRNVKRNHDEIRFWADFLSSDNNSWITDDQGRAGGLPEERAFVIAGDLNADPIDGSSHQHAIRQLLRHRRVNAAFVPQSMGAAQAAAGQKEANLRHQGLPSYDTADFNDRMVGNLRVDYVLPSTNLALLGGGVHWPQLDSQASRSVRTSDHHPVWIDISWKASSVNGKDVCNCD